MERQAKTEIRKVSVSEEELCLFDDAACLRGKTPSDAAHDIIIDFCKLLERFSPDEKGRRQKREIDQYYEILRTSHRTPKQLNIFAMKLAAKEKSQKLKEEKKILREKRAKKDELYALECSHYARRARNKVEKRERISKSSDPITIDPKEIK